MIAESHLWDAIVTGDYIADKTGTAWKVLAISHRLGRPEMMTIANRQMQQASIVVPHDAWATVTKLVPTHEEAMAAVRAAFPEAEEIR